MLAIEYHGTFIDNINLPRKYRFLTKEPLKDDRSRFSNSKKQEMTEEGRIDIVCTYVRTYVRVIQVSIKYKEINKKNNKVSPQP